MNDTGDGVDAFTNFMTLLAPLRRSEGHDSEGGENVFERVGCESCHLATLRTGSSDIAALNNKTFHSYSDFLLHDGRAATIEAAILAHDGQGLAARNRFAALNGKEKAKLLAFLNSL